MEFFHALHVIFNVQINIKEKTITWCILGVPVCKEWTLRMSSTNFQFFPQIFSHCFASFWTSEWNTCEKWPCWKHACIWKATSSYITTSKFNGKRMKKGLWPDIACFFLVEGHQCDMCIIRLETIVMQKHFKMRSFRVTLRKCFTLGMRFCTC